MLSRRADIRDVQHRLERKLVLDAEIVCVGRRNLALAVDGDQAGRREQYLPRAHILHPSEEERRLECGRRVLHQVEDGVALRTIVENPGAAAHDQSLIALDVVSEAEARREVYAAIAVDSLLYSLSRLKHAVGQLARVRHEPP